MTSRSPKDGCTHPSSHTSYANLITPEKNERLRRLHLEAKNAKFRLNHLRHKLEVASSQAHVAVDEALDSDIRAMALESTDVVKEAHPEGSF